MLLVVWATLLDVLSDEQQLSASGVESESGWERRGISFALKIPGLDRIPPAGSLMDRVWLFTGAKEAELFCRAG